MEKAFFFLLDPQRQEDKSIGARKITLSSRAHTALHCNVCSVKS